MRRFIIALTAISPVATAQVTPPFDAAVLVAAEDVRFARTLDLDGDGWMDAVSALRNTFTGESNNYHLVGFVNDQAGHLVRTWSLDIPIYYNHLNVYFDQHDAWAVGDLDADGDQDFVVSTGFSLHAFLSNGATAPTQVAIETDPLHDFRGVALADFDGDGDLDVANARGWATLEIRSIDFVNGTLPLVSSIASGNLQRGRVVAGEFTGDSTPDLFTHTDRIHPVVAGALQPAILFPPVFGAGTTLDARNDAGDLDGDGDIDLITFYKLPTSGDPHGYRILRRISPTEFVAEPTVTSGGPARILVDIDGDGDLDGVCCGGGGSPVPENMIQSVLRIALNDGTGQFAEAIEVPSLGSTAIGGVADLDHDGRKDCVAGRCVYYQRRPISGPVVRTLGTGQQSSRTIADLDADCDPDFSVLPWSVQRNRGDGFLTLDPVGLPPPPPGYARTGQGHLGDWDGDGDEDRLVLAVGSSGIAGFELLENLGSGVFVSAGLVSGPGELATFPFLADDGLAADLDGDLDLDLIVRSYTATVAGQVRTGWLRNEGTSGFVYQTTIPNFVAERVLDLDGDGVVDLLGSQVSVFSGRDISWVRGLGNASFGPPAFVHGPGSYRAVDAGDLDSDGDVDILAIPVVATLSTPGPEVHWNLGGGAYSTELVPIELRASSSPQPTAQILDVDDDGRLDFVVGPLFWAPTASAVVLRRADGSGWQAPIAQVLEGSSNISQAFRTTTVDIDGDGDSDFVSFNRCYRNLSFDGAPDGLRLQFPGGNAGADGIQPLIGADGPFRVGEPVRIVMRGLRPAQRVYLVADSSSSPVSILPGTGLPRPDADRRVLRFIASGAPTDPSGTGSAELAFAVPTTLAGSSRTYTALVVDADAHGGIAISNRLVLTYGP